MTQNDIAYYQARNQRRNMRLERKETKRHNQEQERNQALSAQASMVGALASQTSAAAAQQQANTAQKRYELDWEGAYGMPYGSNPTDPKNYITVTDVITGEQYTTTAFPEPVTYSEKKANAMEKMYKSNYEKVGAKKLGMETFYGGVKIVREGLGVANDVLNLGSKVHNMYKNYSSALTDVEPGTDLIVYGGQ